MQRFGIGWAASDKLANKRFDPYAMPMLDVKARTQMSQCEIRPRSPTTPILNVSAMRNSIRPSNVHHSSPCAAIA